MLRKDVINEKPTIVDMCKAEKEKKILKKSS